MLPYEPFSDAFRADPYPTYARLRREAPIHWAEEAGTWCVARHADVTEVLRSPDRFSSEAMRTVLTGQRPSSSPPDAERAERLMRLAAALPFDVAELARMRNLVTVDPPDHDVMRRIVNRGFTPRRIAGCEPRIRSVVAACLETIRGRERFDLMAELAVPLPLTIIAELLGVEGERHADFKRWSNQLIAGTTGSGLKRNFVDSGFPETLLEFAQYFAGVAEARRREPRDDLVSVLVEARDADGALSSAEVVMFALVLLVAGNETTTNLIGNAVSALLAHPKQAERAAAPDGVTAWVEETLRWDGPIQFVFRRARRDVELAGTKLPEGALLTLLLGSANRDERVWADAERFDLTRGAAGHLGFGLGVHFCLGASLARLEAGIALGALLPELRRLERCSAPEWVDSYLIRGPKRLELAWTG